MDKKTLLIAALAVACGVLIYRSGCGMCRPSEETMVVIAAAADIPPGAVLEERMLETRTLPRAYVQAGAFEVKDMTAIRIPLGMKAAIRIPKGDQVTDNCLLASGKAAAGPATKDKKELSQAAYVDGLRYMQNADYPTAKAKWEEALKLDQKNADARAGLKRIAAITSGGK
ncbi:MAG: hypothetical protein HY952_05720 [Elusimicrobia bacterium]|nr:hypothetical protein [Elusimicrobiota bacterium]